METEILTLHDRINEAIKKLHYGDFPTELYDPIRYIMALGGKRLRPMLVLLSYKLFDDDIEQAMTPATAVELFHNFTLMHDDIMDNAPLRRGKATVHEKWSPNIAILSGDVMLVRVYDLLMQVPDHLIHPIVILFNRCAREVCEGQQLDMNFETENTVRKKDYLEMIRLKTAVLLGFCLELGAVLAGADHDTQKHLYDFGVNMGIGFQLKDDLLDVYADQEKFGKQVGGDIIANKKTYLLIQALETAEGATKEELENWLYAKSFDHKEKVEAVKRIYDQLNVKLTTEIAMNNYFNKAFESLKQVKADREGINKLAEYTNSLINRDR